MLQIKRNRAAFTLIELLVVVIIVAVLAAVGVPLLSANVQRARGSEAEAGLGTVRTALRAIQAENTTFPVLAVGTAIIGNVAGLNAGDLNGRWFEDNDYTMAVASTGATYCVGATADVGGLEGVAVDGDATNNAQAVPGGVGIARSIDQTGRIFITGNCT